MSVHQFDQLSDLQKKVAYQRAAERARTLRIEGEAALKGLLDEIARRGRSMTLEASIPPVFAAFRKPQRYKGAHGGRGSAKSETFGRMLLIRCMAEPGLRAVCVREVQKSLEQSVKRLLEDLIQKYDLGSKFKILNTHIVTPGDGIIIFQGMQNHTAESIKSLQGFKIAWVEEAQSLSQTSLELLRPTLRADDSEIWFTWNPKKKTDPVDKFLRDNPPSEAIVVEANYRDNPFLPEVLRKEMEWDQARDIDKYKHIWLGQYEEKSEARVFKNWRVEEFETPSDAAFLFGGDFGFATDPSVLVRMFVDRNNKRKLYIDAEAYKVGCEIEDTPALYDTIGNGMARRWRIIADSARPETISYLKRHGYPRIVPAKKGAGSVEEGIEFLKSFDIIIHPRCTHTVDEFTMYSFKKHPLTDEIMPVLEDKKNHVIDSARYAAEDLRTPHAKLVEVW